MGLLDHLELQLIHGLPPLPGDSNSNESVKELINLLTPQTSGGIVLASLNSWNPNIPGLKNDGLWSESAIAPGRRLIAGERANPVEIMNIVVSGATERDYYLQLSRLNRLIERCREFWTSFYQIDPVYLKWHACESPGAQYALVYNINLAMNDADDNPTSPFTVTGTLELEREVAWRWEVPPGGNPKRWAYYKREELELWNFNTANLVEDDTEHFKFDTIQNRREWNTTQTDIVSRNYIDIPAADIPGDAPALVEIAVETTSSASSAPPYTYLIGRTTKPTSLIERDGTTRSAVYVLNAGDATVTTFTKQADTGAPFSDSLAAGRRAGTTASGTVEWKDQETMMDLAAMRGRWAFYARCRISGAPAQWNLNLEIKFAQGSGSVAQILPTVIFTGAGDIGTGNTTTWGFIYMGQATIPPDERRTNVGADGRGLFPSSDSNPNLSILFRAIEISGAVEFYLADIIMMPVDEPTVLIDTNRSPGSMMNFSTIWDGTGYLAHGLNEELGLLVSVATTPVTEQANPEVQGTGLTLLPGMNNRLHLISFDPNTGPPLKTSRIDLPFEIRLNIVPRSYGIRDA